ncbi:MAG: DNA topoisomerase IV subunit B [Gammaproteobacteria bacterium]|nr:DNA topoisomerase IV subunit B [Gammaproteobacteria bacterium]|tara:strand:+ start:2109 stop:4001 length:1893 start_codon:yes stop_codon:yes gene_type:complete
MSYQAQDIEVLSGLDPVKRRPGMYTDTTRPNHLVQEVVDNSVDEALAGYANRIDVTLAADGSVSVADNGRGMPIDLHPEEGVPGVELILTKLHAGGKFSKRNYQFSGGLHGVGVSVVNALSTLVDIEVRRDGKRYDIGFANGDKVRDLNQAGTCTKRDTGTTVRFEPDLRYFDSPNISVTRLRHVLRAKAVLCSGLTICLNNDKTEEIETWCFENGLTDYLQAEVGGSLSVPEASYTGNFAAEHEAVEWALTWLPEGGELTTESYVNLIPTIQGGTHVNGLRTGLMDALREYCEFRNLVPRGLKLAPDDLWERCAYVLSVKLEDPQFSGQTKERLSSRECAVFVSGVVRDAFSLYLNSNTSIGDQLAEIAIAAAQQRLKSRKQVARKKVTQGPALPGKLADCAGGDVLAGELFLVEGDSAGGSAKQARDREFQAVMPLRGKILNTWEVQSDEILVSQEVHDIAVALGVDPSSSDLNGLRYGKICILADADSDGLHIATLLCALFVKHFRPLVEHGHVFVAMPPLYRIDVGKDIFYALDDAEKQGILDRLSAEKRSGKVSVTRFKGLGEMNPGQLRVTTMDPDTRRLVQLVLDDSDESAGTDEVLDKLLGKKRASDRKKWLEASGHMADIT